MKNAIKFIAPFFMAFVAAVALNSCQKEADKKAAEAAQPPVFEANFKKQVTLRDPGNAENWMVLEVGAATEAELALFPVERLSLSPAAAQPQPVEAAATAGPSPDAPRFTVDVVQEHHGEGVNELSVSTKKGTGADDRTFLPGGYWYTLNASNCGFGWRLWRNAGPAFHVFNVTGNNCQSPGIIQGYYPNRIYFSSGYWWGTRVKLVFYVPSNGDYTWQHGQFPAGNF